MTHYKKAGALLLCVLLGVGAKPGIGGGKNVPLKPAAAPALTGVWSLIPSEKTRGTGQATQGYLTLSLNRKLLSGTFRSPTGKTANLKNIQCQGQTLTFSFMATTITPQEVTYQGRFRYVAVKRYWSGTIDKTTFDDSITGERLPQPHNYRSYYLIRQAK